MTYALYSYFVTFSKDPSIVGKPAALFKQHISHTTASQLSPNTTPSLQNYLHDNSALIGEQDVQFEQVHVNNENFDSIVEQINHRLFGYGYAPVALKNAEEFFPCVSVLYQFIRFRQVCMATVFTSAERFRTP